LAWNILMFVPSFIDLEHLNTNNKVCWPETS
jgi:hypothetical protein